MDSSHPLREPCERQQVSWAVAELGEKAPEPLGGMSADDPLLGAASGLFDRYHGVVGRMVAPRALMQYRPADDHSTRPRLLSCSPSSLGRPLDPSWQRRDTAEQREAQCAPSRITALIVVAFASWHRILAVDQ